MVNPPNSNKFIVQVIRKEIVIKIFQHPQNQVSRFPKKFLKQFLMYITFNSKFIAIWGINQSNPEPLVSFLFKNEYVQNLKMYINNEKISFQTSEVSLPQRSLTLHSIYLQMLE